MLKWLFALSFVTCLVLAYFSFPEIRKLWAFVEQHWLNLILATAAVASACFAYSTYEKSKHIFVAQTRPLVQVRPIAVKVGPDGKAMETVLSVVNYSGFHAFNIYYDIRYGTDYIIEWLKAHQDNLKNEGQEKQEYYPTSQGLIEKLETGERKTSSISGSASLDNLVSNGMMDVEVKARWENEYGYVFEKRWKYVLKCTTVNTGRSFDFTLKEVFSEDG
jgi:hypothetical protein